MNEDTREFRWYEGFALCIGMIGIQISSEVIAQWGNYFYTPTEGVGRTLYITAIMATVVFAFGRITDAITDPLIGIWSDNTRTVPSRWRFPRIAGRRRPFIFWGSILMTFTGIAFWFPPVQGTSYLNFLYALLLMSLHWGVFTVAMIPLNALGPEIARSKKARAQIGTWVGIGMVFGMAVAGIIPPVLIQAFRPADLPPETFSPVGYQKAATVLAFVSLACFQFPVWLIRERFDSTAASGSHATPLNQVKHALRNRAFVSYFFAFFFMTIGYLALQNALPYWAELGLGGNEGYVTFLLLPFILTAMLTMPFYAVIAPHVHIKWQMALAIGIITLVMPLTYVAAVWQPVYTGTPGAALSQWMALLGADDPVSAIKTAWGAALFGFCGIGQGLLYAILVPALGEIIDYDAAQTGERKEALFLGLHGVAWKASQTLSIALFNLLVHFLGKSPSEPWGVFYTGPVAGVFGLLGFIAIMFFPRFEHPKNG
ncbi:MAG: MFS transporter [Candidatus Hydrogenedentes bacterium]|nr:MFS transporter [Candidatus Hydrogenedentota bacterium]